MSTKSTICSGDDFHLYKEALNRTDVFLKIEKQALKKFSINENGLELCIPAPIWKKITEQDCLDLTLAEKSEEEILQDVTIDVDARLEKFNSGKKHSQAIAAMQGCGVYGSVELSREDQIKSGVECIMKERGVQIEILKKYNSYE